MLKSILRTNADSWAPLPLRLAMGIIFVAHGSQKLFGWFGGAGLEATASSFQESLGFSPGLFWAALAGSGEFFGGLMLLGGALTRLGSLSIGIVTLVAITKVHWGSFFASAGGMEYPLALLAGAVTLTITGGGAASGDAWMVSAFAARERSAPGAPRPRKSPEPEHEEAAR